MVIDSTNVLNQARVAFGAGMAGPDANIMTSIFKGGDADYPGNGSKFLDTLNYVIRQYEILCKVWERFGLGNPNKATMDTYFLLGNQFKEIVEQLKAKRAELIKLQGKKNAVASADNVKIKSNFDNKNAARQFAQAKQNKNTKVAYVARNGLHTRNA